MQNSRMRLLRTLLLLSLGGGACARVQDVRRLSLAEAIELAKKQNPEILIARKQVEAARGGRIEARAGYLPSVVSTGLLRKRAELDRIPVSDEAALELARRSRGTPRIANSRLWWTRNFATSEHDGKITLDIARSALKMSEVDIEGLDKQDRRYLDTLISVFAGGPTGVEALAATMNIPADTLSDEVEPYLLREQFIVRTPRGRMATPRAFTLLGKPLKLPAQDPQLKLFDR